MTIISECSSRQTQWLLKALQQKHSGSLVFICCGSGVNSILQALLHKHLGKTTLFIVQPFQRDILNACENSYPGPL